MDVGEMNEVIFRYQNKDPSLWFSWWIAIDHRARIVIFPKLPDTPLRVRIEAF
jgi:hypothetical protein